MVMLGRFLIHELEVRRMYQLDVSQNSRPTKNLETSRLKSPQFQFDLTDSTPWNLGSLEAVR